MRQKWSFFQNRGDLVTCEKVIGYHEGLGIQKMSWIETEAVSGRGMEQQTESSHQKKMWLKQWSKNT